MQGSPTKKRFPFVFLSLFLLVGMMFLIHNLSTSNLYFCPDVISDKRTYLSSSEGKSALHSHNGTINLEMDHEFHEHSLVRKFPFDIGGNDVLVFLHIQKTGGTTFGKHLVNLDVDPPCSCVKGGRRRCPCLRPGSTKQLWQFSRFSSGWACGLHSDWTELKGCVPGVLDRKEGRASKRRYYYVTFLREPEERYISEWQHVSRGATWKAARHVCDDHPPLPGELPFCYDGEDWSGVTMTEFLDCPYNLGENRQTRMLADLSLVGCYNTSYVSKEERDATILKSAKTNLRRFAYFGLTEFQLESQYMFEQTFGLKFRQSFTQYNDTFAKTADITEEIRTRITQANALDLELYAFAKELFFQRYIYMKEHADITPDGEG